MIHIRTSTIQVAEAGTLINGSINYKLIKVTRAPNGLITQVVDVAVFKGPNAKENAQLLEKLLDHFYENAEATNVDKSLFGELTKWSKPNSNE